jgi:lycopene cyclase domain-containing protein
MLGVVLITTAIFYKKVFSPAPEGFPAYFTFFVATAVVPAADFFRSARPFIDWRVLSLTLFIVVLISLIWEATLAVPYGWWGFQKTQMIGLCIGAWYGLPVEEVGVWITVSYATAIVFEIVKLWQASGKKAKDAFLGTKETKTSRQ